MAWEECNSPRRVRDSTRAVRAVRMTRVILTGTRAFADVTCLDHSIPTYINIAVSN
jgi:hypothetical protein